jgi:hypothetical protein
MSAAARLDRLSLQKFVSSVSVESPSYLNAEGVVNRLTIRHEELREFVALTLRLATAALHDLYLRARPTVRG